jgi:hypothetical protein
LPLGSVGSNPLKYTTGVTYMYLYETRTTLNGEKIHSKGDIGFHLSAAIHLSPVWANDDVLVFKLEVSRKLGLKLCGARQLSTKDCRE